MDTATPPIIKNIVSRDLKHCNWVELNEELVSRLSVAIENFGPLLDAREVECFVTEVSGIILEVYDKHAPLKAFVLSSRRKPWVTSEIRSVMKLRDLSYRRARLTGRPADFECFRELRSRVSNMLATAKNKHVASVIARAPNTRARWSAFRKLGLSGSALPSPLDVYSPEELILCFTGGVESMDIPNLDIAAESLSNNTVQLSFEPLVFRHVTDEMVLRALLRSSSGAAGCDGISPLMVKMAAPSLLRCIGLLINACIDYSYFPLVWRRALLFPLAKTRILSSPLDTRPIALLPALSKVFESVIHRQISDYITEHGLLDPHQTGFRRGHSTQTALLNLTEDVRAAIDGRMVTILVLFDFSRAFDKVPHGSLLTKLHGFNFSDSALRLLGAYLSLRTQAIGRDSVALSEFYPVSMGVPQGSILGPLLFSLYINDLPGVLTHSRHIIYADDTQIYLHCLPVDIDEGIQRISQDANAVQLWAARNGLTLNAAKTKAMVLGSLVYTSRLSDIPLIHIGNVAIPFVDETRNLGLILNGTLGWTSQVSGIIRRVHGVLRSLRFRRRSLSFALRKHLVESLIFPHFDYCCANFVVLDSTRNIRLQRALNACVRFVFGSIPRRAHVTPYRLRLGWLSVQNRRLFFTGTLSYGILAHNSPDYLARRFRLEDVPEAGSRVLRRQLPPLRVPNQRTQAFRDSFVVQASYLLNDLAPLSFVPMNYSAFRTSLFDALMNRDAADWEARIAAEGITDVDPI